MTPVADVRHATLQIAAARKVSDALVVMPKSPGHVDNSWPEDIRRVAVDCSGGSQTRQRMRGLQGLLHDFSPDLVHLQTEPWAVTSHRVVARGWPTVVHGVENLYRAAPLRFRLRRVNTRYVLHRVAGYLNWGTTGLQAAVAAGLPPETPRSVIPGSPPDPAIFTLAPMRDPDGRLRVLFIGRLTPSKGVSVLLEGIAASSCRRNIQLTVVGDGPSRQDLRDMAQRLDVDVDFVGRLTASGAHEHLARSDVLVVPSQTTPAWAEQWGRVVVEAMMTGRPVLVSDSGELPTLVGDPEAVFGESDADGLGTAFAQLLKRPDLLRSRAEKSYRRSLSFHPDPLSDQLVDFWQESLDAWRHRGA